MVIKLIILSFFVSWISLNFMKMKSESALMPNLYEREGINGYLSSFERNQPRRWIYLFKDLVILCQNMAFLVILNGFLEGGSQ